MKKMGIILSGALVAMTLTACQAMPKTDSQMTKKVALTHDNLQNHTWKLVSVTDKAGKPIHQGLFINPEKPLMMQFHKEGRVNFINTCNRMWGNYQIKNNNVIVGDLASTMMMCEPDLMKFDNLASNLLKGKFQLEQTSINKHKLIITSGNQISVFINHE